MAGITMTGTSGIDVAGLIRQLTALKQEEVTRINDRRTTINKQLDAYSRLGTQLSEFQAKAAALNSRDSFSVFKTTVSNDTVKVTTTSGAQAGNYSVRVEQLAQREKLGSNVNQIDDSSKSLSEMGIAPGRFSINGVEIELNATDTLNDLRQKINSATKNEGGTITRPNVTATIVQAGDNDFRLVLTNNESGAVGMELEDLSGGVLQSLGFLDGGVKTTNTDNVLMQGQDAIFFIDNIRMTSSSNTINNRVSGLNFELLKVSEGSEQTNVSVTRDNDEITKKVEDFVNVFNALIRFQNEQTSFVPGEGKDRDGNDNPPTKGALFGDSTIKTVNANLRSLFQSTIILNGQTASLASIGIKTDAKTGMFELDKEKFNQMLESNFDDIVNAFVMQGTSNNSNIQFGRSTANTQEGTYELREVMANVERKEAIMTTDSEGNQVQATDQNGELEWNTWTETVQTFEIRLKGTGQWVTGERTGSIVTFSDGPASGLSITAPIDSSGGVGGQVSEMTFNRGLAGAVENRIKQLTDFENGVVVRKRESLNSRIRSIDADIERAQKRVDAYNTRLVLQFAAMENTMRMLQSQQSAMFAQMAQWMA